MDDQQIIEVLKSSFLFNFRTGNVMVDTFVTGLIIMLSTYIFNMFNNVFKGWDWKDLFNWYVAKTQARIVVSGKKLQGADSTRLEYSTNFFAILYQIKKLECVKANIHELSEVPIQEPTEVSYYYDDDSENENDDTEKTSKGMGTNLIVSQTEPFKMTDDVYGYVNINKDSEGNEKNPVKTEEFQITLYSETLNADELRVVLQGWVKEYESRLNSDNEKLLKYFLYTPTHLYDHTGKVIDATSHYSEFKFESGKSFSNVFYPEKEDIVKRLDFFSNNKAWYKKRGIPYTMGFMFYGEPGCGKTSTIKAIANHTQRNIVSIPLNKIKSAKELLNVFYNVRMNYKDIPLHQRLYVLEDIDAADLKNVVGERSEKENKEGDKDEEKESSKGDNEDSGIDMNLLNMLKSSAAFDKKTTRLTLATLLEVLDGVMEMDGRMLIITTNYPEKLDKALIRPGRIDMKVRFGPMTAKNILEMFEHYFEMDVPSEFDTSLLPDLKWTPAEVTQVILNHMHSPMEGLMQLTSNTSLHNIHLKTEEQ